MSIVTSSLLAEKLNRIQPSPTIAVSMKANELKAQGKDIIGLGAGEPDFDTPVHIKKAAKEAIDRGETKYTAVAGTNELKDAIIAKLKRDNQLEYTRAEIVVGTGAKQVLYNALTATVEEGDEVIIPAPYWVSYPDITLLSGGTPVIVSCSKAQDFKMTPKQLEEAITPKTKWLIINSPSNPTGNLYTSEELQALAKVLLKHPHVYVISDDIYEHLLYEGEFSSIASAGKELKARTLVVNGVSKAYSMTGWRIGYGAGPEFLMKAITKLQSQSTSCPSSVSQAAAVAALNGTHAFLDEWKKAFKERRDLIAGCLDAMEGISCGTPEGAFYVFPSCDTFFGKVTPSGKTITSSVDFAAYLLEEVGVAVVPGIAFGLEGYFRISYATSKEQLEEAAVRIEKACQKLLKA